MKRILSIDWDYFVHLNGDMDWSHQETSIFLETMWSIRRERFEMVDGVLRHAPTPHDLTKLVPFTTAESVIHRLPCLESTYQIGIAESHAAILQLPGLATARDVEIMNVDAHHDLFYGKPFKDKGTKLPDCGSWGSYLISRGQIKSWTQVYPAWRKQEPEPTSTEAFAWARKQGVKVSVRYGAPPRTWDSVDAVFVCRSGCWVPPEYDKRFSIFCRLLGCPSTLPERAISPPSPSV